MTDVPAARRLVDSDRAELREYAGAVAALVSALDTPDTELAPDAAGRPDLALVSALEKARALTRLQESSLGLKARVLARIREQLADRHC